MSFSLGGGFPRDGQGDFQLYTASGQPAGATVNRALQFWLRPRGCRMTFIFFMSAGGGGAGGRSGAALSARNGGGGGGAGGAVNILIPTLMLPEKMGVLVGQGGKGGASDSPGANGTTSALTWMVDDVTTCTIINGLGAANPGQGAASNLAGSAGTSPTISWLNGVGLNQIVPGQNGGGGTTVAGTQVSALTHCNSGGGGGAGMTNASASAFVGGPVFGFYVQALQNAISGMLPSAGGIASTGAGVAGGGGDPGYQCGSIFQGGVQPFYFGGGAGGGSSNDSAGGPGGHGAPGSGGGGGGAGVTGNGGKGGDGGGGLVLIWSW